MKKNKLYIIGIIILIAIILSIALIFFSSNVIKKANTNSEKEVVANTNSEKEVVANTNDKKIFGTFKTDSSWVEDPSIPKNLIETSEEYSIIKAKVKSIGEAKFLKLTDPTPYTPIEIEVEEFIDGISINNLKTIYIEGGEIKVSEFLKTLNDAEKEKMELNNITKEDAENMYISYISEEDYKLEINNEYIFVISGNIIQASGYGIFTEDSKSATTQSLNRTRTFKNVLSGNKLSISNSHELN